MRDLKEHEEAQTIHFVPQKKKKEKKSERKLIKKYVCVLKRLIMHGRRLQRQHIQGTSSFQVQLILFSKKKFNQKITKINI